MRDEYVVKPNVRLITRTSDSKSGKTITQVFLSDLIGLQIYLSCFNSFFCLKVSCSDISEGQQWHFCEHAEFTSIQREYMLKISIISN